MTRHQLVEFVLVLCCVGVFKFNACMEIYFAIKIMKKKDRGCTTQQVGVESYLKLLVPTQQMVLDLSKNERGTVECFRPTR